MNYDVVWSFDAIEMVQRIYDASDDQEGIINTVKRIGLELGANPTEAGESRDRGKRVLFKYPLVVWFSVETRMKSVEIFGVRAMRQ